jgi:hypothetical protein
VNDRRLALWPLSVPIAISVLCVIGGLALARGGGPAALFLRHDAEAGLGPLLMAATAVLMAFAARGAPAALPLLMLVFALDLSAWGIRYVWSETPIPISAIVPRAGLPPGAQPDDTVHGDLRRAFDLNRYVLHGLHSSAPYAALVPPDLGELEESQRLRIAGVNWVWTGGGWIRVAAPMPRARLMSDWRLRSDHTLDIRMLDVAHTALLDVKPGPVAGAPGTADVVRDRPGDVVIDTDTRGSQLLVLTERFHPGWQVQINGRPATALRIYGEFLGCVVPQGKAHVAFVFAPASARHGLWLTAAGLVATLLGWWGIARAAHNAARVSRPAPTV